MDNRSDVVLGNALLWARNPMTRFRGGIRIRDGKIMEVFNQKSLLEKSAMDLGGMHIIPGLIDAHRHFFISALLPLYGDASVWTSKDDALCAIAAACRAVGSDRRWVFLAGFDNSKWANPALPSIQEIDIVALGLPVLIIDSTCHKGLISTEALRRTGINRAALRCPSDIDINRSGRPNGTIWEDALGRVLFCMYRDIFQAYSVEEKRQIIINEANRCLQKGLTHVHDPGVPADVQRLLADAQEHTPLKISWSVTGYESLFTSPELKDEMDALHSPHAPKSVKFFLDGANRTAANMPVIAGLKAALKAAANSLSQGSLAPFNLLLAQKTILKDGKIYMPYLRFVDDDELIRRARFFTEKGYRLVMHALGNVAASQAARVVKALDAGERSSIEHMLVMSPEDLEFFAGCGAVASIQPGFIPFYADTIERMSVVPYLKTFAMRSLISHGVTVCISSDGPCAADDPLHNIRRAVDRKKLDGTLFDPEESISEIQALTAGTIGGSDSLGIKNGGVIEGAPATFCVVDGDPFSDKSRVVQTWIDGKRAF
ncbi:MAG: amidohydrolase family protein [Smithella sp.]